MFDIDVTDRNLSNLNSINILLGKNGCGKSTLLKVIEAGLRTRDDFGLIRYMTPERGGVLSYDANVDQQMTVNVDQLSDTRRKNQFGQFRQQSVAQFRKLELLTLREIEKNQDLRGDPDYCFDTIVDQVNDLLDYIEIRRAESTFEIFTKGTLNKIPAEAISSGESELISLAIECLIFAKECSPGETNILLIDEPDVHLHPDLQVRLCQFVRNLVEQTGIHTVIATHSTAILGAFEGFDRTHIAFMSSGQTQMRFEPISEILRRVLPVFGAHPLSNIFNSAPVLLVEGEDDERIWQQAVRSSTGALSIFPVSVDTVTNLNSFEAEVEKIVTAVYDEPHAYSLRDRDDTPGDLADRGPVIRCKLACRAAENLLLSDDVLRSIGITWTDVRGRIEAWLEINPEHPHYSAMSSFKGSEFDRMNADIKKLRNDMLGIIGTYKPWEVLVGQAIAGIVGEGPKDREEHSLISFLGPKVCEKILGINAPLAL